MDAWCRQPLRWHAALQYLRVRTRACVHACMRVRVRVPATPCAPYVRGVGRRQRAAAGSARVCVRACVRAHGLGCGWRGGARGRQAGCYYSPHELAVCACVGSNMCSHIRTCSLHAASVTRHCIRGEGPRELVESPCGSGGGEGRVGGEGARRHTLAEGADGVHVCGLGG
jgi:hypothetical protein